MGCDGGGSPSVTYSQPPELSKLMQMMLPMAKRIQQKALNGMPLYNVYQMPNAPMVKGFSSSTTPTSNPFTPTPGGCMGGNPSPSGWNGKGLGQVNRPGGYIGNMGDSGRTKLGAVDKATDSEFITPDTGWSTGLPDVPPGYTGKPDEPKKPKPATPPPPITAKYLPGMDQQSWLESMQGTMSNYNIPGVASMLPSKQWYNNLAPSVKAGVMAPWQDASKQLTEQMASMGQLGNPVAGISGQAATGLGDFWSKAGQQQGLQLWNMTGPQMQQAWQANLDKNKLTGMEKYMDTSTQNQSIMQNYANQLAYRGEQQNALQAPWNMMPGYTGSTASIPYTATQETPSSMSSMLPMMAMGALTKIPGI